MKFLKIKKISESKKKIPYVYDITVKDNNNFFANNMLVHNCHNYGTTKMLEYLKYPFKYKIALSATVVRSDNAHWDIKKIFDYNQFNYTPKQGLVEGVLNEFDFIDISVIMDDISFETYTKLTREINLTIQISGGFIKAMNANSSSKFKLLKLMNERTQLVANYFGKFSAIQWICENHKENKILIFNQYNSQTNKCYWHLLESGIKVRVTHSGVSDDKRQQDIIDFRNNKFNCLAATRVVDEGWDLPAIDLGILMAGNSTARQTIQRLGRILRKKSTKSMLYQIFCKNTIEEKYSLKRSELFKEICSDYKSYCFKDGVII